MKKLFKRAMNAAKRSLRLTRKLGRGIESTLDNIRITKPTIFEEPITITSLLSKSGNPFYIGSASRIDLNAEDGIYINDNPTPRYIGVIEDNIWKGSKKVTFSGKTLLFSEPFNRDYFIILHPQNTSSSGSVIDREDTQAELNIVGRVAVVVWELP